MKAKRIISIALSLTIILSSLICAGFSASADGLYNITVSPVFGQTEARSILAMINELRTSDDAWYWNKDNETITECKNLEPLEYDYGLEKTAMQRAAEIAVYFSHTRPDGRDLWTAYKENGISLISVTCGENIAAGYSDAAEVNEAWREDFADYENQNHRRNLLNKKYTFVGIGHAYYNGYHFWVQEFSSKPTESPYTEAMDKTKEYSIPLSADFITDSKLKCEPESISMLLNEKAPLPVITASISINSEWNKLVQNKPVDVQLTPEFTVQDNHIIEIENNKIIAKKTGTTAITASVQGNEFTIPVTVKSDIHEHTPKWSNENGFIVKICTECNEELSRLQFEDLGNYVTYADYVEYTSTFNKFISGTNPPYYTEFSPRTPITRAMFVAILYRMAGNPYDGANPYTSNPFTDINTNAYYYNAACWALDEGITNQTTFKPNNNVTREQTARFLFAYAESKGLLGDEAYKNVNLEKYPDYNSVHNWAVEPLQWANYNDMITGTQQGYINPQGATQRIHATRILYGFGKVCNIGNFE